METIGSLFLSICLACVVTLGVKLLIAAQPVNLLCAALVCFFVGIGLKVAARTHTGDDKVE